MEVEWQRNISIVVDVSSPLNPLMYLHC